MPRRLLCLMLVPTILVNQGLLLAHTHLDQEVDRSDSHTARAHFHLGLHTHDGVLRHSGHSHAGHADGHHAHDEHVGNHVGNTEHGSDGIATASAVRAKLPIGEHESDAIYCPASRSFVREADTVDGKSDSDLTGPSIIRFAIQLEALRHIAQNGLRPTAMRADSCPLYLRILFLRI